MASLKVTELGKLTGKDFWNNQLPHQIDIDLNGPKILHIFIPNSNSFPEDPFLYFLKVSTTFHLGTRSSKAKNLNASYSTKAYVLFSLANLWCGSFPNVLCKQKIHFLWYLRVLCNNFSLWQQIISGDFVKNISVNVSPSFLLTTFICNRKRNFSNNPFSLIVPTHLLPNLILTSSSAQFMLMTIRIWSPLVLIRESCDTVYLRNLTICLWSQKISRKGASFTIVAG